jgi:hypothetical protein
MAGSVQMSRSRGSVSGLALVLLGAWGGLAPFIGPYFKFGFEPDKTWVYSTSRLYLSILPGAIVLLAGLIVLISKSRGFGGIAAFFAALGGAWFVLGAATMSFVANNLTKYSVGSPIGTTLHRILLTDLACFAGLGVLIVFFAAIASGRVSISAYKDFIKFGDAAGVAGGLASVGLATASPAFNPYQPAGAAASSFDPFQPTAASPAPATQEQQAIGGQAQFPSQYPGNENLGQGQYPDSFDTYGAATNTYSPPGQVTYSPGQTQYPPVQEQTNSLTAPTEEQQYPPTR